MFARSFAANSGCPRAALLLPAAIAVLFFAGACAPVQPQRSVVLPTVTPSAAAELGATVAAVTTTVETAAPQLLTATVIVTTTDAAFALELDAAPAEAVAAASEPVSEPDEAGTVVEQGEPLEVAPINAPVELRFVDIDVTAPVEAMKWEVVRDQGERVTRWVLPEDAAGWHPDSAQAGEPGNMTISGSQFMGAAVFAPLALGEIEVGQEIELLSASGDTFAYSVTEVSEPLALDGDPEASAALLAYLRPTLPAAASRLTLLTGWPDFTTTHRLVVVAELVAP